MYVPHCILPIAYAVLVPRLLLPSAYCHCLVAINRGPLGLNKHCAQAIFIVYTQTAVYTNIAMFTCSPRVSACCSIAC